jgi:hypothetical protein
VLVFQPDSARSRMLLGFTMLCDVISAVTGVHGQGVVLEDAIRIYNVSGFEGSTCVAIQTANLSAVLLQSNPNHLPHNPNLNP